MLDRSLGKPTQLVGGDAENPIRVGIADDLIAKLERLEKCGE